MSELKTIALRGGDFSVKYYQEGRGDDLVFLHSAGGLPAFTPELVALSKSYRVTAPLLPAFGSTGEEHLHEDVQKLVFWGWDLLDALKIERSILVGHSFGGIYVRVFADLYPKEVAGLVLIDPSQETFEDWTRTHPEAQRSGRDEELAKASPGVRDESAQVSASYEQARAAKVPAGIPVILITAMKDDTMPASVRKVWVEKHQEWIDKVPSGKHILAEQSSHFIQADQPQLVIDAIKQVFDQMRSANP